MVQSSSKHSDESHNVPPSKGHFVFLLSTKILPTESSQKCPTGDLFVPVHVENVLCTKAEYSLETFTPAAFLNLGYPAVFSFYKTPLQLPNPPKFPILHLFSLNAAHFSRGMGFCFYGICFGWSGLLDAKGLLNSRK